MTISPGWGSTNLAAAGQPGLTDMGQACTVTRRQRSPRGTHCRWKRQNNTRLPVATAFHSLGNLALSNSRPPETLSLEFRRRKECKNELPTCARRIPVSHTGKQPSPHATPRASDEGLLNTVAMSVVHLHLWFQGKRTWSPLCSPNLMPVPLDTVYFTSRLKVYFI